MKFIKISALIILSASFLMSCGFNSPSHLPGTSDGAELDAPLPPEPLPNPEEPTPVDPEAPLTFETIKVRILTPQCTRCHNSYAEYAVVARDIEAIVEAVETDAMPFRAPPLPNELKDLLAAWVEAGLPE